MPFVAIETNVVFAPERKSSFLSALAAHVADMLDKPLKFVMVSLRSAEMHFGTDSAPTAFVELKSISLQRQQCAAHSASLCAFLERELGVAPQRVYIQFSILDGPLFGWNSATF